jgi:hypothetical protein
MEQLPIYLAISGAALAALAFVVYLLGGAKMRIPGTVLGCIAGIIGGVGVGMLALIWNGYSLEPRDPGHNVGNVSPARASSSMPPAGLGGPPVRKPPEGTKIPENVGKVGKVFGIEGKK